MADNKNTLFKYFKVAKLLNGDFEFNDEGGKRHPLGKYNSSISNVLKYLNKIIDNNNLALQTKIYNSDQANYDVLTDALLNFMNTFMTHVEVMGGIINDFFPQKKEQDKIRKELNKSDARNYVGVIINHIKHNGGTLNPASIVNSKNEAILGFFVVGYEGGSIGPYTIVHNKGDDLISINYFIRKVVADLFLIDGIIASYIGSHIQCENEEHSDETLSSLLEKINNIPYKFFDKEYKRNHLMYSMKNGIASLEHLKFKRNMIMEGRISVSYTGDGVTRTLRIPLGAAS